MRNYMNSTTKNPVITIVKDYNVNSSTGKTFYNWLQERYGCYDGKRHASPTTPEGFADYAKYTVEELDDYIWEPQCNKLSEWYEWLLPFFQDEQVLERFIQLWHEYRREVPFE